MRALLADEFVIVSVQDGSVNTGADLVAAIDGGLVFHVRTDRGWRLLSAQGTEISRPG